MSTRLLENNPFEDGSARHALRGLPPFEEALARLLHTVEHARPCGIVRGPAGTGKSALLACVEEELRSSGYECGHIDLRCVSADEFPWRVACELGAAPVSTDRGRCWRHIEEALTGRSLSSRTTVLAIDQCDEMRVEGLDDLRRLLALVEATAGWTSVLAAARSDSCLIDALARDSAELRIELAPFDADETALFLEQVVAMTHCGAFTPEASRAIHQWTGGVLREILRLCRLALLARFAEDAPEVTAEMVRMAAGELIPPPSSRFSTRQRPALTSAELW